MLILSLEYPRDLRILLESWPSSGIIVFSLAFLLATLIAHLGTLMVLVLVKPLVKKFFAVLVFKKSPNVFTSPQGTLFFDSILLINFIGNFFVQLLTILSIFFLI